MRTLDKKKDQIKHFSSNFNMNKCITHHTLWTFADETKQICTKRQR